VSLAATRPGALRLGIFVTHPIQYFAPLWRQLAATPGIDLTVHFFSDHSVRGGLDRDFGVNVSWDVPILEGYRHEFISRHANLARPLGVALPDAGARVTRRHFDTVMVHGYAHRFEWQIVRAARRHGVRTLLRGELTDMPRMGRRSRLKQLARAAYLRWYYGHIDTFCYIGQDARQHLRRRGVPESRLFFAPYSVDTALFTAQQRLYERETCRAALGIQDEQLVILFSGKLIERKAPRVLIEAIRQMVSSTRVVLLMMGEGELRAEVEAMGRPLLGERLHLLGFVNQSALGRYYRAADVFVLPSHFETWGLVVNEAMQFGLPAIVSSKVGCRHDLIIEGETGLVFPQGDASALARCLQRFHDDPVLAKRLGANAVQHVSAYSTTRSADGVRRALGVM